MTEEILTITGMTCAACATRIEKTLKKFDGVKTATVNLPLEKLNLAFDEEKVTRGVLLESVKKIGYGYVEDQTRSGGETSEVSFRVEGMSCASCAARIEKTLQKIDGVHTVSVNYGTETAGIGFDPAQVRPFRLKEAVEKIGYRLVEEETESGEDADQKRKDKEFRKLRFRFSPFGGFQSPSVSTSRWRPCLRLSACPCPGSWIPCNTRWSTDSSLSSWSFLPLSREGRFIGWD